MGLMKHIDIEVKNSYALQYILHEIEKLENRISELEKSAS